MWACAWASSDVTLSGYSIDRVLCIKTNEQTDRLVFYGEPTPESMGPWGPVIDTLPMQKFLLMDSLERIDEIRPLVEKQFGDRIHLTVAIKGMLEVGPCETQTQKPPSFPWDHLKYVHIYIPLIYTVIRYNLAVLICVCVGIDRLPVQGFLVTNSMNCMNDSQLLIDRKLGAW